MPRASQVSDELLARAAELRAGGAKWEVVGVAVNRSADTVASWPRRFPVLWKLFLKEAEERTLGDASAELIHVLRLQLRSTDERTARDAARSLTDLRLGLAKLDASAEEPPAPTNTSPEAARLLAFLDGHTDDQLAQWRDAVFPHAAALRPDPAQPGPATGTP